MQTESHQKPFALLSVTNKEGLVDFARGLVALNYALLSTGGTARLLREHHLPVTEVAEYTGSSEILDGRVKTLHPKVHGAILYDRHKAAHQQTIKDQGIGSIALVVVNLYRFKEEALDQGLSAEAAIEHIDIGGPTMLRAAAKNWQHVLSVIDPKDYAEVLAALRQGEASTSLRRRLAAKTFATISAYDKAIASFLGEDQGEAETSAALPSEMQPSLHKLKDLRYGENPQQKAALYSSLTSAHQGFDAISILQGKELSYNNFLDLDAATALAAEFSSPAAVIVKHTNPCGVALAREQESLTQVFNRALAADPKSAFGGIVAVNRKIDRDTAAAMSAIFIECIAAPDYTAEALAIFSSKTMLRVIKAPFLSSVPSASSRDLSVRSIRGALLVQTEDNAVRMPAEWQTVSRRQAAAKELGDLHFAMQIAKHVKSNAIVYVRDGSTVAVGAGQMSRIDAAKFAAEKALEEGKSLKGAVMASDAFFPFRDCVDLAASYGVAAIVQPGGSKRDQESIEAADEHSLVMMFTGERHFRH